MPADARVTHENEELVIETTSVLARNQHFSVANTVEKVVLTYEAFDGLRIRTYKLGDGTGTCRAIRRGDSQFPAPEEGGDAPAHEIGFRIVAPSGTKPHECYEDTGPA